MMYPSEFKPIRGMNHSLDFVSGIVASMKANAHFYVMVTLLLAISVTFFVLGSSSRTLNFDKKINGLSYSLGFQIGRNLGTHNINLNMTMFLRGLDDGRYGYPSLLTNRQFSEANEVLMKIMQCQATTGTIESQFHEEIRIKY